MFKKSLLFFYLGLVIFQTANSQSLAPSEINSAGLNIYFKSYSLSYSIGGAITNTLENGPGILTQGFQQPNIYVVTSIQTLENTKVEINVYPNPVKDYLSI